MCSQSKVWIGAGILGLWWFWVATEVQAHTVQQARVFHILVTKQRVECYLNFLLPRNAKAKFWVRWFDRDHSGRLEPAEQRALGRYLAMRYLSKFTVTLAGKAHSLVLKEVQNSRLRGDSRKGAYAWDYRWSVKHPDLSGTKQHLSLTVPVLFVGEDISVALVPMAGQELQETKTSYILRKKEGQRAICRINREKKTCWFAWKQQQKRRVGTRPSVVRRY